MKLKDLINETYVKPLDPDDLDTILSWVMDRINFSLKMYKKSGKTDFSYDKIDILEIELMNGKIVSLDTRLILDFSKEIGQGKTRGVYSYPNTLNMTVAMNGQLLLNSDNLYHILNQLGSTIDHEIIHMRRIGTYKPEEFKYRIAHTRKYNLEALKRKLLGKPDPEGLYVRNPHELDVFITQMIHYYNNLSIRQKEKINYLEELMSLSNSNPKFVKAIERSPKLRQKVISRLYREGVPVK